MPRGSVSLEAIASHIEDAHQRIVPSEKAVLLLGMTGSGKSTLLNYLSGIELRSVRGRGVMPYVIDVMVENQGARISHRTNSETTIPNSGIGADGTVYWDCPGFFTNTGAERNIADAFYIREVFEKSKQVKIVIVASIDSLATRSLNFLALLDSLGQLLGDFDSFRNSVTLVVTAVTLHTTRENVCEQLQEIFDDRGHDLSSVARDFLDFFIRASENIALFHAPTREGELTQDEVAVQDKRYILETLDRASFIPNLKVGISVMPESLLHVKELFERSGHSLRGEVVNMAGIIDEVCHRLVLAKHFLDVSYFLEGIEGILFSELENVTDIKTLKTIFANMNLGRDYIPHLKVVNNKLSELDFFHQLAPEKSHEQVISLLATVKDNLRPTVGSVKKHIGEEIHQEISSYVRQIAIRCDERSAQDGLVALKQKIAFFNEQIARLTAISGTRPAAQYNVHAGLQHQSVAGDGDCFYRAVTYYLGHGEDVALLRNVVAANLADNAEQYRGFVPLRDDQSLEEYITSIATTHEWAGELEINLLIQLLDRPIVIIGPDGVIRNRGVVSQYLGKEPIFVSYNGGDEGGSQKAGHYDVLVLRNGYDGRKVLTEMLDPAYSPGLPSRGLQHFAEAFTDYRKILVLLQEEFNIVPENDLLSCIKILEFLRVDCDSYVSELKEACGEIVKSLIEKEKLLFDAEKLLAEFANGARTYIQTIDTNTGILTIDVVNRELTNLRDRLSQAITPDDISLQRFGEANFAGCSTVVLEILQRINVTTYPNLKISPETRALLQDLQGTINEWIAWYSSVLPGIYHYLSVSDPHNDFVAGVNAQTFRGFLQNVQAVANIVIDITCDRFKIVQVNELIAATWQDSANHRIEHRDDHEVVNITGNCIRISEVLNAIVNGRTKELTIECFDTVYLDRDLIAPGMTVMIVAPHWRVAENITIDLSGANALNHAVQAAHGVGNDGLNGRPGVAGLPGGVGQNGGNFYGKGQEFIGLARLRIISNGGNGGRGQDGGNGSNGLDGADAPKSTAAGLNRGQAGGTGGNAGAGGSGGAAGYPGIVQILKDMEKIDCVVVASRGQDGSDGNNGRPGNGGENGDDWLYQPGSHQQWVSQGKGGYYQTVDDTKSHAVVNNTHASNGSLPTAKNAVGRQLPPDVAHIFEMTRNALVTHFREIVTSMFSVAGRDCVLLKIQRPLLDRFVPQAGFGVLNHAQGNFSGHALVVHQQSGIWHSCWSEYTREGMVNLLKLRLDSVDVGEVNAQVVIPDYIWDDSEAVAQKLSTDILSSLTCDKTVVLLVLNLHGKHWVGLAIDKGEAYIKINYIDSEQCRASRLLTASLLANIQISYPEYDVSFVELKVAQQRYDNCGPEVIENFVRYLTGERVEQESTVALHSELFERAVS